MSVFRNFIFVVFVVYTILVYLLSNIVSLDYIDEVYAALLGCFLVKAYKNKEIIFFFLYFAFCLFYSFRYPENLSRTALLVDFVQQIKPFLFFYFFYNYPIDFTWGKKLVLKALCVLSSVSFLVSFLYFGNGGGLVYHPFVFGICSFCFAILFYYLSKSNLKNLIVVLMILFVGLLSLRAKYMGEVVVAVATIFFVRKRIKINFKYFFVGAATLLSGFFLVVDKFKFYFVESDGAARYLLYKTMPQILMDYFPFGSGFASYATHASGKYYSLLYYKYGIAFGYGMSEDNFSYIADTYFPVLAQFGVVGIVLFLLFWYRRYTELVEVSAHNIREYQIGLIIIAMVMIESVAGPVFVMSFNFIPMAILGSICGMKNLKKVEPKVE